MRLGTRPRLARSTTPAAIAVAAVTIGAFALCAPARSDDGNWELAAPVQVASRPIHAFDAARRRIVAYTLVPGEYENVPTTYTVAFGPPVTLQTLATTGPRPTVTGRPAIYDPVRDRLLVHEGTQVRQLDFSTDPPAWSVLAVDGIAPPARTEHSAVYDPVGDRMIVFGGLGASPHPFSGRLLDVWSLSLSGVPSWTDLTPPSVPSGWVAGLAHHSAVYDPVRHRMIVYGGSTKPHVSVSDAPDVVALSLSGTPEWTVLSTSGMSRSNPGMVYDPQDDRLVVFGGRNAYVGYVWGQFAAYSFAAGWSTLAAGGGGPSARWGQAMAWDASLDQMLLQGGGTDEVWLFRPAATVAVGDVEAGAALAVRPIGARIGDGEIEVVCSLPRAGAGTLELYDAAGRKRASQALTAPSAGTMRVRLAMPASVAPGVMFVRLRQGSGSDVARLVLLR